MAAGLGATDRERREPLPGDDLVRGRYQSTHAITIGASPAQVWPWIVQVGYGRGGWYSYDRLERAVGAGDFAQDGSARSIVADLQGLAVGDTVLLSPNGGLTVVRLEAPHRLVLHYRMDLLLPRPPPRGHGRSSTGAGCSCCGRWPRAAGSSPGPG